MSDRLLLRFAADGRLSWLRQGAAAPLRAVSTFEAPPREVIAAAAEVLVLVPGRDVLLSRARLQARSRAQLLQALPWAVEEQLMGTVEAQHFAAATRPDGDEVGVAVVARARMQEWQARLAELGVEADVLLPDTLALPNRPGYAQLLLEADGASLRLGPWSALACTGEELPAWLAALAAREALPKLSVHDARAQPAPLPTLPSGSTSEAVDDALAFLAAGLAPPAINLLQGEFVPRRRAARRARGWRIAAALAAAVLLLGLLNLGVEVGRLAHQSSQLQALAEDAVRGAFPDLDASQLARLSPEQLMQARLERMRGSSEASGLLPMLAGAGRVIAATPRLQTRGLEYRNGVLELAVRVPDVATLDSVRERLAAASALAVELTAATPGAGGVDGRLRIGGGGG